jgi:hypothetical protein
MQENQHTHTNSIFEIEGKPILHNKSTVLATQQQDQELVAAISAGGSEPIWSSRGGDQTQKLPSNKIVHAEKNQSRARPTVEQWW